MPRGAAAAQKVGVRNYAGFRKKPPGLMWVNLKDPAKSADQPQEIIARFLCEHDEIEWLRQWKTAPSSSFPYGEKLPCVDQHEDGTPDPGYAANLNSTFTAYVPLIWRNAPIFQRQPDGTVVRDGNGNKVLTGYADHVAVWETTYTVYDSLREVQNTYRGLMSRDFRIKRTGSGAKDTKYHFSPADVDGGPQPMSAADQQLAATQRPNLTDWLKVPTYEELAAYLNGPAEQAASAPQSFAQQAEGNESPDGPNPFLV